MACSACDIVAGHQQTPGGIIHQTKHFVVHAIAAESPLEGWVVLTSRAHVRGFYDLPADALGEMGQLAAKIAIEQKRALGAEHVYAMAIGDVLLHSHLHLIPRYANTPDGLRGIGAFKAPPEAM